MPFPWVESAVILCGLAVLLVCWLGTTALVAAIGGWRRLARVYRTAAVEDTGTRWWNCRSAYFGVGRYKSCLRIGVGRRGLRLRTIWLFRYAHPPLFIPWEDIEARPMRLFLLPMWELTCRRCPRVRIRFYRPLAEQLARAAADAWPAGLSAIAAPRRA